MAHGSILTMLAISFERYYAICKPLKVGYKCTKVRALVIIVLVWLLALLATLPLLFIAQQSSAVYVDGSQVQVCLTQANSGWSKAYFLTILILFFFLPLLVLIVIYAAISRRLCSNESGKWIRFFLMLVANTHSTNPLNAQCIAFDRCSSNFVRRMCAATSSSSSGAHAGHRHHLLLRLSAAVSSVHTVAAVLYLATTYRTRHGNLLRLFVCQPHHALPELCTESAAVQFNFL